MIILLSPSKTLRKEKIKHPHPTKPIFPEKSRTLMNQLKNTSRQEIKKLMKISDNLTDLNYDRFQEFETDFSKNSGEPAIYTFKGDVFQGLEAENWSEKDLAYAESRLFILSGLYGLLRPSTLVQPYRLEMGTALSTKKAKTLYEFWGSDLTELINKELSHQQNKILINLPHKNILKLFNSKILKLRKSLFTFGNGGMKNGLLFHLMQKKHGARWRVLSFRKESKILKDRKVLTWMDMLIMKNFPQIKSCFLPSNIESISSTATNTSNF